LVMGPLTHQLGLCTSEGFNLLPGHGVVIARIVELMGGGAFNRRRCLVVVRHKESFPHVT
jgi:hypothetical protein